MEKALQEGRGELPPAAITPATNNPSARARRAFCCGNWLNGPPKQTIPPAIYKT